LEDLAVGAQHGVVGARVLEHGGHPGHVGLHTELLDQLQLERQHGGQRLQRLGAA
jgi:hypothetical protein